MAADQHKKRINATSFVGYTSRQLHRVKRKKMGSKQYDLNMRANIFLEWDNKKKSVVSKREQIGIAQRHLIPFMEAGARGHIFLADVISVPQEIFELESLSEVFSYEVWQNLLSEDERSLLSQFLPKGAESDNIVQDLLAGINFHFGNPFKKWGSSLCFGKLHPDNIIHEEQSRKTSKKAYYSDLQKYHDNMIGNLRTWKEILATCKDPEDVVQRIWRERKHADEGMPTSETGFYDTEEHLDASPDSCSWATSDKAYSSDNQNLVVMLEKSKKRQGFLDKNHDSSNGLKAVERPKKGEKLQNRNIQHGDGAKYMSYIKVSKEQHQRVKSSMKHSSNSIKPMSLNNVLGSIDVLRVQPFEVFEEEERKKLHYYWLELANKNVPEGFGIWRKRQLLRQQLAQSLGQEMRQKLKFQESTLDTLDEEKDDSHEKQHEPADDSEEEIIPAMTVEDEEKEGCLLQGPIDNGEANCDMAVTAEVDEEKTDYVFDDQTPKDTELSEDDKDDSSHVFIQDQHQQQQLDSPNDGSFQFNSIEMESFGNDVIAKTDEVPSIMSEYPGNRNHVDVPVSQQDPHPTTRNVWTAGNMHGSYYCSTSASDEYASAGELSLGHPQFVEEQPVQMIDLEAMRRNQDVGKNSLHRQPDDVSFFTSYPNKARNELLQSFFKNQGSLPSHQEQKQLGLDFRPAPNLMMEGGQSSGHFREQVYPSLTLDPRQKRLNDLYLPQNIQESVYCDGGRYSMPKQEHLTVNIHDWAPLSHMNGDLSQNWFQSEHGWSMGAGGGTHGIGSGSNSDQTLYCVVSECNELRPSATYDPVGSAERFIVPGNGSGIPSSSNVLQQSANSLNYLSSHDTVTGIKTNNTGWMGMTHQNSGVQESMGKPFSRSWNQ
ncbi:Hypothetical predicted protein [Olea europaea subsp. europaea]|uniref:DEUBAD domain-containing protein n=2 Tax=Olea europaea subsp. europaea TaxID=158383 RepID=A0A8S0SFU8_OLEEU|nr:Hypothetical predicted protein [Olea europaea subsp. europaea]